MPTFEIVDAIPSRMSKSRFAALHLELIQTMLKVPPGKSLRKGHKSLEEAKSYYSSLSNYIKKQKLKDSYFVSLVAQAAEDGKFYVYIGRRAGE